MISEKLFRDILPFPDDRRTAPTDTTSLASLGFLQKQGEPQSVPLITRTTHCLKLHGSGLRDH